MKVVEIGCEIELECVDTGSSSLHKGPTKCVAVEFKIKSPDVIRLYNEKCMVNLIAEYPNIVRDSTVPTSM
jgi:hypothetical protein